MTQPPAPEHPPPAPDWILGDDGHWKPPPFGAGGGPRPAPAPPPAPNGGPGGRAPGRPPGRGGRGLVAGVAGLLFIVGGWALKAADGFEIARDLFSDETTPVGSEAVVDPEVEESMRSEDREVLGPAGDPVCPEAEWVGRMTDRIVPPEIVREGVERAVNDVDISGIECRYGDDIRVGKLHGFEDRVYALQESGGPVEMREGPFPGSVRFDDPTAGTATIVYEDEDEVMEAFVQLPLDDSAFLISLADLTLN